MNVWVRNALAALHAAVLMLSAGSAFADPVADIKSLVTAGRAAEAYRLAAGHPDLMGNPEFDFYFGMSAIDAGHSAEGVLALERYLLLFPSNHQARLELARGYFILGEDARAREEFTAVLGLNPPPKVVANIERYLDAIRAREAKYQTSVRGYVEAGMGIDSNINSGVSSASIVLPVLGVVSVGSAGQQQGDWAHLFGAGFQVTHPVAPGVMTFGGVDWERKQMKSKDTFDTEAVTANGGASWIRGNNLLKATLSYSTFLVDHNRYRDVTGLGGEWQRQLSELETVSAGLQFADINHTGANATRDANLLGATVGYRRAMAVDWQPVLSASLTIVDEDNRRNRDDLGRMMYVGRLGVTASPAPRWGLAAHFTYQDNRYQANDPILATRRLDRFHGFDVSATYMIDRDWSIRGELSLIENYSNLALYEFDRSAFAVKLRYAFK
ncbi:MAG: hypothetical protein AB1642_10285 [Pseudomonadota bacterium]